MCLCLTRANSVECIQTIGANGDVQFFDSIRTESNWSLRAVLTPDRETWHIQRANSCIDKSSIRPNLFILFCLRSLWPINKKIICVLCKLKKSKTWSSISSDHQWRHRQQQNPIRPELLGFLSASWNIFSRVASRESRMNKCNVHLRFCDLSDGILFV